MPWKPKTHEQLVRPQSHKHYDRYVRNDDGFYERAAWKRVRNDVLSAEPMCRACKATIASQVDHILPRATHPQLAFVLSNLQPLCQSCHSQKTARERTNGGERS